MYKSEKKKYANNKDWENRNTIQLEKRNNENITYVRCYVDLSDVCVWRG